MHHQEQQRHREGGNGDDDDDDTRQQLNEQPTPLSVKKLPNLPPLDLHHTSPLLNEVDLNNRLKNIEPILLDVSYQTELVERGEYKKLMVLKSKQSIIRNHSQPTQRRSQITSPSNWWARKGSRDQVGLAGNFQDHLQVKGKDSQFNESQTDEEAGFATQSQKYQHPPK